MNRRDRLLGLGLILLVMIAFLPVLRAGFIWDDDAYVTQNPLLTAPDGLRRIWFSLDSPSQYFPLTYTTFYIERNLCGLNPFEFHLVNLLLHAANALLVWRLLLRLRLPGAWLAAAFFALHPVQVESVAWITERKNVLMGFFFLLSLWGWIRFVEEKMLESWRYYLMALVCYGLALAAKTTACTLPAAMLLILWLKKIPINWRRLGQVAPFAIMGLGMGLVTIWWERHQQHTQGKLFEMGPLERILVASRALWFYLGKLFWPVNLTFSYPHWTVSPADPRAYVWLAALVALAVLIWRMRSRPIAVAALFFAATLAPVLGFIMLYTFMYSFVADHYQYLACIGPIALVAGLVRKPFVAAALLLVLGALTWRQCEIYRTPETLWRATLAHNPDSWLAHNNLGAILRQSGRVDEAIDNYQEALQHAPGNESIHFNLALALCQKGRAADAITQFAEALEIDPTDVEAQNNLAWLLATAPDATARNGPRAVQLATQAVQLTGGRNPVVLGTLAAAFAEAGRFDDAAAAARQGIMVAQAEGRQDVAAKLAREMGRYEAKLPLRQ